MCTANVDAQIVLKMRLAQLLWGRISAGWCAAGGECSSVYGFFPSSFVIVDSFSRIDFQFVTNNQKRIWHMRYASFRNTESICSSFSHLIFALVVEHFHCGWLERIATALCCHLCFIIRLFLLSLLLRLFSFFLSLICARHCRIHSDANFKLSTSMVFLPRFFFRRLLFLSFTSNEYSNRSNWTFWVHNNQTSNQTIQKLIKCLSFSRIEHIKLESIKCTVPNANVNCSNVPGVLWGGMRWKEEIIKINYNFQTGNRLTVDWGDEICFYFLAKAIRLEYDAVTREQAESTGHTSHANRT